MPQIRNQWIDIAKGITIILMVLGHSSLPKPISNFIWSFHMPLFFIASGWMTNWEKYGLWEFVGRKFKSLAIPFTCYSVIVLIWRELTIGGGITTWLMNGWDGYALWFIPVLFLALIVARAIHLISNKYVRYAIVTGFIVLGYALCYKGVILPWTLSTVPYAVFLIFAGSYLKKAQKFIDEPQWWLLFVCLLVTAIVSYFWRLDLCCNQILPFIPLTIGAFSGTILVFTMSSYIAKYLRICSRVLQAVGKETYIIVAFSQIVIITINQYLTHSAPIKYTMLVVLLMLIKYGKDAVVGMVKVE